jgi:hypothetical protein
VRDEAEHQRDNEVGALGARRCRDAKGVKDRWVGVLFAGLGVLLLPWALWLGYSLPERKVAHHWDLAWAGFDVVLSVALLATAFALVTDRSVGRSFAAATGALLLADAWFDVVTAEPGRDRWLAAALAVGAEIPLAILCFVLARPAQRR